MPRTIGLRDPGRSFARRPGEPSATAAPMNPFAIAIMLGMFAGFGAALLYALVSGSAWLLAALAIGVVALFVRWGR